MNGKNWRKTALIALCVGVGLGVLLGIGDACAFLSDIGLGGDDDGIGDFMAWFIYLTAAGVSAAMVILFIGIYEDIHAIRNKILHEK